MKLWKVLGLAGVVGVAATGALVVKSERKRRSYQPDEVRAQLHQRFAAVSAAAEPAAAAAPASPGRRLLRTLRLSRER